MANQFAPAKKLKEVPVEDLGGGLNEAASQINIPISECMKLTNFRVSEDGKTKIKRPGLTKLDSVYSFGSKKVYGVYGIEEDDEIKILACLEDSIQLKSEGSWSEIFAPTTPPKKPVSIIQDKGLVFIAGYEKLITVKDEEAFYSGIEAPQAAPTVVTGSASSDIKAVEYPDSNQDNCGEHKVTASQTLLGQSFKPAVDCEVTSIKLKLKKVGSPTGNLWAEVHSSKSGTSTSKDTSAAQVGDATDDQVIANITASFATYTLTFSGTKPSLSADAIYYIVIYTDRSIDTDDFVVVGFDNSDPEYSNGKYWEVDDSLAWSGYAAVDLVFEVYAEDVEEKTLETFGALETGSKAELRGHEGSYLLSQCFKLEETSELTKVRLPLNRKRPMTIAGRVVWVEIHSSNVGTSATKEASTNIVGEASDEKGKDDLPEDFTWIDFDFSGTKPDLTKYETFIDATSNSGQKVLKVDSTANFEVGGTVVIGEGTERKEAKIIDSISAGVSLTMTRDLDYTHTLNQADLVENCYYLVLYVVGNVPPNEIPYVEWTRQDGHENGNSYHIDNQMNWSEGIKECSFEIFGYETDVEKLIEHPLTKVDDLKGLRETAAQTLMAQSFQVYGASDVTKVKLLLAKVGSPTGNVWVEIHHDKGGTSETINISDEIVGEASDVLDATADLSAFPAYTWETFDFSGVAPSLEIGETYYIVVYGSFSVSDTDYIRVAMDKVDPTYSNGSRWDIDSPNGSLVWTELEGIDLIFELYLATSDLIGDYSFVVTYLRGGNYPCESNPSPASNTVAITAGNLFELSNIPVSSEPEVDEKNLWRTEDGGTIHKWVARIDNADTTYEDETGDAGLGDEVSHENYPPPAGDCIEIWDDTLWVSGVQGYMEGLFHSRLGYLEQFPATATSYMPLREKEADPVIKKKEFKNVLYGFKSSSIWAIGRSTGTYIMDKIITDRGLGAADSLVDCGEFLMFLSNYHKIEIFDGYKIVTPVMSNKVKKTLKTINKIYAYRSTAQNYGFGNQYRLAIPTGSSTIPNKTIICNYKTKNFFVDTYHQNICSINVLDIAKGERAMVYGTEEGEIYKVDSNATTDDGQLITSEFQTGWIGDPNWLNLRKIWVDFILPENKILVFKVYSNFRETPELSISLDGSTPTGADADIRNVIHRLIKTAISGSFFSFGFINAEDLGGNLEVIKLYLYLKERRSRRTIQAE